MKKTLSLFLVLMLSFTLVSCSLRKIGGDDTDGKQTSQGDITSATTEVSAKPVSPDSTNADTTEKKEDVIKTASFIGCGDNIIYFGTYRDAQSLAVSGGRKYNFKPIYENVKSIISGADISFINQETVISGSAAVQSYPTFNSPVDIADDLTEIGFDIINIANNHMMDQGASGLFETFENWGKRSVTLIGCYPENNTNKYITYYEKNGIKIAFVSYTYGTNRYQDPAAYGIYASYMKYADIEGEITEARKNADFVIASVHWGDEGSFAPNDEQKTYAKRMADSGADVIIGHHPHVIQPVEWIEGKDGNRCLAVYSLGNFVHEQAYQSNVVGGMISFDIEKVNDGRAAAKNVQFIPTVCHYPASFYNNKVYLLKDYTAELANSHAVRTYYNNSMSLDGLCKIVRDTISAEFLPDYLK